MSDSVAHISLQRSFWNGWNASHREFNLQDVSERQAEVVTRWLGTLGRPDLRILEAGCGSGWFCPMLSQYGQVTGTDLSHEVLARAQRRFPEVHFVPGDFFDLELGTESYDVVVSLEVLSHVADQAAFLAKIAGHLRPGGSLMLATQNRFVLQRFNRIPPPAPGQLRRWVDRRELRDLLERSFEVSKIFSVSPISNRGLMRIVNSRKLNAPIRAVFGQSVERLKESAGLGWTLMALARKPSRAC